MDALLQNICLVFVICHLFWYTSVFMHSYMVFTVLNLLSGCLSPTRVLRHVPVWGANDLLKWQKNQQVTYMGLRTKQIYDSISFIMKYDNNNCTVFDKLKDNLIPFFAFIALFILSCFYLPAVPSSAPCGCFINNIFHNNLSQQY